MPRRLLAVTLAAICCGFTMRPQEFSMTYISELQAIPDGSSDWVNLLTTESSFSICPNLSVDIGTISTCKTNKDGLMSDLLACSNIDGGNIPLALSRAGVRYDGERWSVFAGVGNVNDDFFVTPLTSLFTNGSCGLFPTISCNFPIADYPEASVGIEGRYRNGGVTVCSAIYTGEGHHGFFGRNSVFRVRPSRDGIFNINVFNYSRDDDNYNVGFGLHSGCGSDNGDGTPESLPASPQEKKKNNVFYWIYAEQKLVGSISLIAQLSQCPTIKSGCRNFCGVGLACRTGKYQLGVHSCFADFIGEREWASELTVRYRLSSSIDLQPSLHYVKNSKTNGPIGLLRMSMSF